METTINESIQKAAAIVDEFGGTYELFVDADDVKVFIADVESQPEIPEIWVKRIESCKEILAENLLPCIFDTMNAQVESVITSEGFTFGGKKY